jgi:hypothetical protein
MYNPYTAAFAALTCKEAQRFYTDTAIDHACLSVAVVSIAARRTVEAGESFRRFHDCAIVPFTLLAVATIVEFFVKPEPPVQQKALAGFVPSALLPGGPEPEDWVMSHAGTSDRVLITPFDEAEPFLIPVQPLVTVASSPVLPVLIPTTTQLELSNPVRVSALPLEAPEPALEDMSVTQLRKLAKAQGIPKSSKLSKAELLELFRA